MAASPAVRTDYPAFARTPEALLFDPAISARAKALFAILDRHASPGDSCFPGRERLSDYLGCSLDSVDRALNELRSAGWLTSHYERETHRNVFVLHASPKKKQSARVRTAKPHPCGTEEEPENENQKNSSKAPSPAFARGKNGREDQQPNHPYLERLVRELGLSEHDTAKVLRAAHRKPEAAIVRAWEASRGPGVRDPLAVALAELAR